MKNLKLFVSAAVAAVAIGAMAPVETEAQSFVSENFINGTNLYVQPSSTNAFGATNVYNYNPQQITSNAQVAVNTFTTPYTYTTNWVFTTNAIVGQTNIAAIKDVDLWADRDGTPPSNANITVHLSPLDPVQSTNVLTFNFASVPSGGGLGNLGASGPAGNSANSLWSFTVQFNPTNDVVYTTNLPTTFLQGAGRLRLLNAASATQGTTSGTNGIIKSVRLNGWKP